MIAAGRTPGVQYSATGLKARARVMDIGVEIRLYPLESDFRSGDPRVPRAAAPGPAPQDRDQQPEYPGVWSVRGGDGGAATGAAPDVRDGGEGISQGGVRHEGPGTAAAGVSRPAWGGGAPGEAAN